MKLEMGRKQKLVIAAVAVSGLAAGGLVFVNSEDKPVEYSNQTECDQFVTSKLISYLQGNSYDKETLRRIHEGMQIEHSIESSNDCLLAGILYNLEKQDFTEAKRLHGIMDVDGDNIVFSDALSKYYVNTVQGIKTEIEVREEQYNAIFREIDELNSNSAQESAE